MNKFRLSMKSFQLLETHVEDGIKRLKNVKKDDTVTFEIEDEELIELQMDINDEIVLNGMDNQDTVNQLGIELYAVYDEILYQKKNQK